MKSPDKLVRVARHVALATALGVGLTVAATVPAHAVVTQLVWDAPTEDDCYRLMSKIYADSKSCVPPDGSSGDRWDGYGYWR